MVAAQLLHSFRSIWDTEYSNYKEMPGSAEDVAQAWADAFEEYYKSQGAPIPGVSNPMLAPAIQAFKADFLFMIKSNSVLNQLAIIITNLHLKIVAGVNSTGLWQTTPPSIPLNLQPCFLKGNYEGKAITVCSSLATTIDAWVHTTFSVNTTSGVTVVWI